MILKKIFSLTVFLFLSLLTTFSQDNTSRIVKSYYQYIVNDSVVTNETLPFDVPKDYQFVIITENAIGQEITYSAEDTELINIRIDGEIYGNNKPYVFNIDGDTTIVNMHSIVSSYLVKDLNQTRGHNSSPRFFMPYHDKVYFHASINKFQSYFSYNHDTVQFDSSLFTYEQNWFYSPDFSIVDDSLYYITTDQHGYTNYFKKMQLHVFSDDQSQLVYEFDYSNYPMDSLYWYYPPFQIISYNNHKYLQGFDNEHGQELWMMDSGNMLHLVTDLQKGIEGSCLGNFISYQDKLFFTAKVKGVNNNLFYCDKEGEVRNITKYIKKTPKGFYVKDMSVIGGKMVIAAADSIGGASFLWTMDGNASLKKISDDFDSIEDLKMTSDHFVQWRDMVFFEGRTEKYGSELWAYDGENSPFLVYDFDKGWLSGGISDIISFNDRLYFVVVDADKEITKRSGTLWYLNNDFIPEPITYQGYCIEAVYGLTKFGNELIFRAKGDYTGSELWGYQYGEEPYLISNIDKHNRGGAGERNFFDFKGEVYFTADDGIHGNELFKLNNNNNPVLVQDINRGKESSNIDNIAVLADIVFFQAEDDVNGERLWCMNENGKCELVENVYDHKYGSDCSGMAMMDNQIYFCQNGKTYTCGLDKKVKEIKVLSDYKPVDATVFNGDFLFVSGIGEKKGKLYNYSGDKIVEVAASTDFVNPHSFYEYRHKVYFFASSLQYGEELFVYDGKSVSLVKDFNPGVKSSYFSDFFIFQDKLLFAAKDPQKGYMFWEVDKDNHLICLSEYWKESGFKSTPFSFTAYKDELYFIVYQEDGLWVYDGENKPEKFIADLIQKKSFEKIHRVYSYNDRLYVVCEIGNYGEELWKVNL